MSIAANLNVKWKAIKKMKTYSESNAIYSNGQFEMAVWYSFINVISPQSHTQVLGTSYT